MKKLILTCALIASASIVSFAQSSTQTESTMNMDASKQPAATAQQAPAQQAAPTHKMPSPEQIAERRAKIYEKQLGLNKEQYQGVYDAELQYMREDQAARANGGQPGQGQSMQMNMAKDAKIKRVLTPEQYAKYDAGRSHTAMTPASMPQQQK